MVETNARTQEGAEPEEPAPAAVASGPAPSRCITELPPEIDTAPAPRHTAWLSKANPKAS